MDLDEDLQGSSSISSRILKDLVKFLQDPAKILQDPEGSLKILKDPLRS